ncbi:hypothetical protein LAJ19_21565 (plasmid) [Deinococcus taeanensis]|uniref:hypothetical protein n=1 Tax=Deinococcus taeanensis TaxID=2737050 RepID=UPI001CDC3B08|nr:hypothetical protein [Deinococcus taeanensis]UBV45515.1 hypothetical protein LAJ19_21565 [Deinococcus taeanensis]
MTLAGQLGQGTEKLKRVQQHKNLHDHLSSRATDVRARRQAVQHLSATVANTQQFEFPEDKKLRASARKQLEMIETLHGQFQESPAALLSNELPHTLRLIDQVEQAARDALREQWRAHVDAMTPSLPEVVLDVLATQPAQTKTVKRIKEVTQSLRKLRDRYPVTSSDLNELRGAEVAIRSTQQELQAAAVPDEVVTFLKDCTTGGATLSTLTPGVMEWLRAHQVTHAFAITMRRA